MDPELILRSLRDKFAELETLDLTVNTCIIHPRDFTVFSAHRDISIHLNRALSPQVRDSISSDHFGSLVGNLWGAFLFTNQGIPEGGVVVLPELEWLATPLSDLTESVYFRINRLRENAGSQGLVGLVESLVEPEPEVEPLSVWDHL